jgi:ABC-type glutathione transport system ATPase component
VFGRTGHPVATTPGPYRAEHLAYLVELANTGHYQTVTQTTVDLDDIAPAHRACGRHRPQARQRRPHPTPPPRRGTVMIEAHELTKRYGDKTAVDTISFTIAPGSVTGFLGPNGAGKSTTMRMIMGLDRPTSGGRRAHSRDAALRAPLMGP